MAAIGRFEKRQIGARVKQAMQGRAKAGHHNGGPRPYGYRYRDETPDGKQTGPLVPFEPEAAVIRRI